MAKLYQDELIKQGGNQKVLVLEDGFVGFQSLYRVSLFKFALSDTHESCWSKENRS